MDGQELIQLNIQMPAGALDGFSKLAEQLRLLAAAMNGSGAQPPAGQTTEQAESTGFDFGRFEMLSGDITAPESIQPETSTLDSAQAAQAETKPAIEAPELAEAVMSENTGDRQEVQKDVSDHDLSIQEAAPPDSTAASEAETVQAATEQLTEDVPIVRNEPESQVADAPAAQAETTAVIEEAPASQAEAENQIEEIPVVRMEPESHIAEAEAVWAETAGKDTDALSVQPSPFADMPMAPSAGFPVSSGLETAQSRWVGVTEELAASGPAPLTAEAVSLAFRRDGRRYDNGFPLY